MGKVFIYSSVLMFFIVGCDTREIVRINLDDEYNYYPLEVGHFIIYNYERTVVDVGGEYSEKLLYKTIIADSFINNDYITFVINNYTRSNQSQEWEIEEVQTVNLLHNDLVVQSKNASYTILKFPLVKGNTWDGNKYNVLEEDMYELREVGVTYEVGEEIFGETTIVYQNENLDELVETDYRMQVFGKGIGVIYSELKQVKYCTEADCFGLGKIEEGLIEKKAILEYGKE